MDLHALASLLIVSSMAFGGFLFARRFGAGAALEQLERANRILESRVLELEAADRTKAARITELEAKTDVTIALSPVVALLEQHEHAAERRTERTLNLLSLIADRLGPDIDRAEPGAL